MGSSCGDSGTRSTIRELWGFCRLTVLCFKSHWKPEAAIVNGDELTPNAAGEAYLRLVHSEWTSNGEAEHSGELAWQRRVFRGRYLVKLMEGDTVIHQKEVKIDNDTHIVF